MGGRVLVTVDGEADPAAVLRDLEAIGGATVRPPTPELPAVLVATLTEEDAAGRWCDAARGVPGVLTVEPDALRWDLGGDGDRGGTDPV